MNGKVARISAVVNAIAVLCFAISMLIKFNMGSYISSSVISVSFVIMMCAYCFYSRTEVKVCGIVAAVVSAMYATLILIVYFAQLTTVRLTTLEGITKELIDFQQFGLFFNYDLLGYGLMGLATFFAGLTVEVRSKLDRCLKLLLTIHGVFFPICFIVPMLGVFNVHEQQSSSSIGTILLVFWCIYFIPIGLLSYRYFEWETKVTIN